MAVMDPLSEFPARSSNLGSSANTEGVYPARAGGSPHARPISRWARAKRVTESIIRITFFPWFRKYSAMAVPTYAAFSRTREDSLDVAHTITERLTPSG